LATRISASVGRSSEHVIAIYQSDLAFLHLLKHSGLTQEVIDKLERTVEIGFGPARTPVCCEEVSSVTINFRSSDLLPRTLSPAVS
jgi:hypothetical protein